MKARAGVLLLPEEQENWYAYIHGLCTINGDGCWIWQGSKDDAGYGRIYRFGKNLRLHRAMYMAARGGSLASTQFVCHTCDVPACCNPDHLFLGTYKDNHADMVAKGRHPNAVKTVCKLGHPFTEENTAWKVGPKGNRMRNCRECIRINSRARYRQQKRSQSGRLEDR